MLCEQCKQREATTHIQRVINGQASEFHLCAACAREAGLASLAMPNFGVHLSDLFSGFLGSSLQQAQPQLAPPRCGLCGSSLREITQSGRVGCARCYETFYDALEPALRRIHGALEHKGNSPQADPAAQGRRQAGQQIARLREEIAAAVREEEYERAAKLRDEIRRMEEGGGELGAVQ
jgi:protein arginine kinase activator